jgi:hypothetical protein
MCAPMCNCVVRAQVSLTQVPTAVIKLLRLAGEHTRLHTRHLIDLVDLDFFFFVFVHTCVHALSFWLFGYIGMSCLM